MENIPFLARQIFFELIFGLPTLIYQKFGPLAKKVGHPWTKRLQKQMNTMKTLTLKE
jgi:hypothetical protein